MKAKLRTSMALIICNFCVSHFQCYNAIGLKRTRSRNVVKIISLKTLTNIDQETQIGLARHRSLYRPVIHHFIIRMDLALGLYFLASLNLPSLRPRRRPQSQPAGLEPWSGLGPGVGDDPQVWDLGSGSGRGDLWVRDGRRLGDSGWGMGGNQGIWGVGVGPGVGSKGRAKTQPGWAGTSLG